MKALNLALVIAGGALAGVAVGLLFAPKKGSELRSDIADYVKAKCPRLRHKDVEKLVEELAAEVEK